jgi:hypothetical protein
MAATHVIILFMAINNVIDPAAVIERPVMIEGVDVILAVEFSIADWSPFAFRLCAFWNLVVNVKVFCASSFACAVLVTTTMPSEHLGTIHVAIILMVSEEVIGDPGTTLVAFNLDVSRFH